MQQLIPAGQAALYYMRTSTVMQEKEIISEWKNETHHYRHQSHGQALLRTAAMADASATLHWLFRSLLTPTSFKF
eukprot:scaffold478801_cov15-Prasinocladus_malaysianus.AAC.1